MDTTCRLLMLSGSKEYRSAEVLPGFARWLRERGPYETIVALGEERGDAFVPFPELVGIDLLFVFCKRMELCAEQLGALQTWCTEGRPVIGVRTASHAFQQWPEFDKEVLGGDYSGHGPDEAEIRIERSASAADHPVLTGIPDWTRPGKMYWNRDLGPNTTTLLTGIGEGEPMPVAWCNDYRPAGGRSFYTSMGCVHDFDDEAFKQLLLNAICWAL